MFISWWKLSNNSNQENSFILHGTDTEGVLVPGFTGQHEHEQGDNADEEGGQVVVHHVEHYASPDNNIVI